MNLFPQPTRTQPAVQYIPVPYRAGGGRAGRAGSCMRAGPRADMKRWWLAGWMTAEQWRALTLYQRFEAVIALC